MQAICECLSVTLVSQNTTCSLLVADPEFQVLAVLVSLNSSYCPSQLELEPSDDPAASDSRGLPVSRAMQPRTVNSRACVTRSCGLRCLCEAARVGDGPGDGG